MLNKIKSKAGMTLMEVMVSLLIMVLLVVGMGTGMDAGMRVYSDAHFESSSAALAGIINSALTDVLQYAEQIKDATSGDLVADTSTNFIFTNLEYGLRDADFELPNVDGLKGVIHIKTAASSTPTALVNSGAYGNSKGKLQVIDLHITYYPPNATGSIVTLEDEKNHTSTPINRGGFFYAKYTITSADGSKQREAETVIRQINN